MPLYSLLDPRTQSIEDKLADEHDESDACSSVEEIQRSLDVLERRVPLAAGDVAASLTLVRRPPPRLPASDQARFSYSGDAAETNEGI